MKNKNSKKFFTIFSAAILGGLIFGIQAYADLNTSLTDTISVTIESNCTLEYGSTAHENGNEKGTWSNNALSVTMENGTVDTNIGKTNFAVTCNDASGFNVNIDTTPLQDSGTEDLIPFMASEPTAETSSWGIYNGSTWIADGGVIATGAAPTASATFSATYGVGIDSTQSAGTYTADVTYTLTHPAVAETDYYTLTFEMYDSAGEENAILSTNSYKIPKKNDGEEGAEGTEIYLSPGSIEIINEYTLVEASFFNDYYGDGWDIDGEEYSYNFYVVTEDATIKLMVSNDGGCIAAGSKIAMANGTEKNIEDIQTGDEVLAYSNKTGTITSSQVMAVWSGVNMADTFDVQLANGNRIKVVSYEYMFDTDAKEWLLINRNSYQSAIGKNVMVNNNGNIATSQIIAIDYAYEEIEHYTLYTDETVDYIANNIVMMLPFYFANLRYTIGDDYKIDMDEYNANVAQYGLYTYEEFADFCSQATFDSLGIKDMKHVVEKGYITFDKLAQGAKDLQEEIDYYNSL